MILDIVLLLLFSCTNKTQVPKNILPPEQMQKILLDLMEADELIGKKAVDSVISDSFSRSVVYKAVFTQHKTNKDVFKKSFAFYESHPQLLKVVLDSIKSETKKPTERSRIRSKNKNPLLL